MSKFHTNSRDRASKKYAATHEKLRLEIAPPPNTDALSKQERKRAASQSFRATGA